MSNGIHLVGGGWDPAAAALIYGPFLAEAGPNPQIACVMMDEGDSRQQFRRWVSTLTAVAPCRPLRILLRIGSTLDVSRLGDADALLVSGGLTPAYADALIPVAPQVRAWLGDRPYCGFSAGAALAAQRAIVGGWLVDGRPLVPDDTAEDLDEITTGPGLGLIPFSVDVHAGQWGTLPRLLEVVSRTGIPGVAIDESTLVRILDRTATVSGFGHAHLATRANGGEVVRRFSAGERFAVT